MSIPLAAVSTGRDRSDDQDGDLAAFIPPRPAWMAEALCRGTDPAVWFPTRGGPAGVQKALCRACPVRAQCLAAAMRHGETIGLWGGLSGLERRGLRIKGVVVTGAGDVATWDRPTGGVLILANADRPAPDPVEARRAVEALDVDRRDARVPA